MQITTKSQAVETYYRELAELRGLGATTSRRRGRRSSTC